MSNPPKNEFKKILVLGAQGQLGCAFRELLSPECSIFATRNEVDLSRPNDVVKYLNGTQPSLILNAAAYTAVDRAETESDLAYLVNAETPGRMAEWCASHQVPLVHFSTDYVFSGQGTRAWVESDAIDPMNAYGRSKAEGEKGIAKAGGRYLIFRTSWVYDTQGKNFLNTMLKLGQERDTLSVVNDQFGAPTLSEDLARGSWQALQRALQQPKFPSGIYHLCGAGETTWHGFATAIFEEAARFRVGLKVTQVKPILSSEFPTPAKRPLNSRLNMDKTHHTFDVKMPDWRKSLNRALEKKFGKEI